jgi:hypothetical protein
MSDPNPLKTKEEVDQVRSFLHGRSIEFLDARRGSDPPDVIVDREGLPQLEIEVTKYHPEQGRVGMEKRAKQFGEVLDGLIRQSPRLRGVAVAVHFRDTRMPSTSQHVPIASEMIRFIEHCVDQGWVIENDRRFSVVAGCQALVCVGDFFILPVARWPLLAKYVSVVYLSRMSVEVYLPSQNFYAQAGYCSPYPEAFLEIFTKKENKVREAIKLGRYAKQGGPLFLLVLCNIKNDLTSEIYGADGLQESVKESGFDFDNSLFDEIWLMELERGRSKRLYPWLA